MSNSTRPGGYDERLVVPLEASRRGAHRARTNPLVAALPLLAVVVVVAAVIGVAYAMFLRPGNPTASDPFTTPGPGATTSTTAPGTTAPSVTPSVTPSKSASASSSPSAAGTVNYDIAITVYNQTAVTGLAKRVANFAVSKGFKKAAGIKGSGPSQVSQTTVFYSKDSQAATAKALSKALGMGPAEKTTKDIGAGLVIVAAQDADSTVPQ